MTETHHYHAARSPVVSPGGIQPLAADMTAHLSADATLSSVQEALSPHRQWLPIDGPPEMTIGQLVEFNSSGPLRLGYGAWRDLLLGAQFINGKDELISAGGSAVKNVAGYDLTKYMVGQGGVFGRVVTVTTRTYRKPAGALLAKLPADVATLPKIITTGNRPQWAMLTKEGLQLGYLGDEAALDFYEKSVLALSPIEFSRRTLAQDIAHRASLWRSIPMQCAEVPIHFRVSVPPMRVLDFVKSAKPDKWVADAAFGIVLGVCNTDDDINAIRGFAKSMGGSGLFRSTQDGTQLKLSADAVQLKILQRLKTAFDPQNKLKPLPQ